MAARPTVVCTAVQEKKNGHLALLLDCAVAWQKEAEEFKNTRHNLLPPTVLQQYYSTNLIQIQSITT